MSYLTNNNNILSDFELSSTIPKTLTPVYPIITGYRLKHTNGNTYDIASMYNSYYSHPGFAHLPNEFEGRVSKYTFTGSQAGSNIRKYFKCSYDKTFGKLIGAQNEVYAMALSGTDIYVGGEFTTVYDSTGPICANRIAKYNTLTSSWSVLGFSVPPDSVNAGNGTNGSVRAIAVSGTDIYIGGYFTQVYSASGINTSVIYANRIAKYNTGNNSWSVVGSSGVNSGNTLNGTNGIVYTITVSGTDIYVGGVFTEVYSSTPLYANRIAKYNNGNWSVLGSSGAASGNKLNGTNGQVRAIAVSGTDVYIGGDFTEIYSNKTIYANRIAKYNGNWSVLGGRVSGTTAAIGNKLNGTNGEVRAIAINPADTSYLYVGGSFSEVYNDDTKYMNNIAIYWMSQWLTVGSVSSVANHKQNGVNGLVMSIVFSGIAPLYTADNVTGRTIYICGQFSEAYNSSSQIRYPNGMAKYMGGSWYEIGSSISTQNGINGYGSSILVSDTKVYVGGYIGGQNDTSGYYLSNHIVMFDEAVGSWFRPGTSARVRAIATSGTDIYVGGEFTTVNDKNGQQYAKYIAKYDTTTSLWSVLGSSGTYINHKMNGTSGIVRAIAVSGTNIYIGGDFTEVYNNGTILNAKYIAIYNTGNNSWSVVGNSATSNGTNGIVRAITISGNNIYVGGNFTQAYDSTTKYLNNIAKYSASTWSQLGNVGSTLNGTNGSVTAIAVLEPNVYIGGSFSRVYKGTNTTYANNIAKYNGSWSVLGSSGAAADNKLNGTNGQVHTIAICGTDIYVGGVFTELYSSTILSVSYFARYNTSTMWSSIGTTIAGSVYAIAISGKSLYFVGESLVLVYNTETSTLSNVMYKGYNGSGGIYHENSAGEINSISISDRDKICIGGRFTSIGMDTGTMQVNRGILTPHNVYFV
jgi:hypothetical protein